MITQFSANKILNALCAKAQNAALGSTAYVGLSKTAPTAAGGNVTEPVGNGYARVRLGDYNTPVTQKMGSASNGTITNTEIIYFPEATGAWGECTHFLIYDLQSGGNLLAAGELTAPISPTANTIPIVRVGELDISIS